MVSALRLRHYWSILLAQLFLIVIAFFMKDDPVLYALFAFSLVWVFGSVIVTVWRSFITRSLALISGAVVLLSAVLWSVPAFEDTATTAGLVVCALAYAVFVLIAIVAMLKNLFATRHVTSDTIVGSICIYLLLGMFFAFVFAALDIVDPRHFNFGIAAAPAINEFREYLYFSYTTISTLGYGDMLPIMPLARLLTSLECVAGPVYLAILVARLVGMHISQGGVTGRPE